MGKKIGKSKSRTQTKPDAKKTDAPEPKKGMMDGTVFGVDKKGLAIGAGAGGLAALALMGGDDDSPPRSSHRDKEDEKEKGKFLGVDWWIWVVVAVAVFGLLIFFMMRKGSSPNQTQYARQQMGAYGSGYGMQQPMRQPMHHMQQPMQYPMYPQ